MKTLVWDVLALAGVCVLAVGLWMVHPAAALIVVGGGVFGLGVVGAKLWRA